MHIGDYDHIDYTVSTGEPFERVVLNKKPNDVPNRKANKISKRGAEESCSKTLSVKLIRSRQCQHLGPLAHSCPTRSNRPLQDAGMRSENGWGER